MISQKMSYKNYVWSYNPSEITISEEKDIKEFLMPFCGNIFQNHGRKKRIITGKGDFFGDDCLEQFNKLRSTYLEEDLGYLKLPDMSQFLAVFHSLEMIGEAAENIISYSFEFWEKVDYNHNSTVSNKQKNHITSDGENLFTIAAKYGVSVTEILALNSNIKRPDILAEGQKVILP